MATSNEAVQAQNASGHTMYVAVEVSRKSWTVALHARNTGRIGIHTLPAADTAALAGLVDRARDALECEHGARPRVLCGYEAGYEGFWLARRLAPLGIEPLVLDPASLPASRKAKRAKTDRLDAAGMVRALTAFDRGEPSAMSPVRIPSVEEEDRRRLLRERRRLVKQRTMLANSVKGLLMLHGVFDLDPRKRDFAQRLDAARTGYGTPLPPGLCAEVRRTTTLLAVVEGQIAEVEAERDRIVARAVSGAAPAGDGGKRAKSGAPPLRRPIGRRRPRWTPRCRAVWKALSPWREPSDRAALAIEAEADPAEWRRRSRSRMVYRMEEGVAFLPQGRAGVWPNASRAETRRLMDRVPPCGTSRP